MLTFFGTDHESSKRTCFDLIGYAPAPHEDAAAVWDFHLEDSEKFPFQIISAPARTSKSFASSPEVVHDFFPELDREAHADGRMELVSAETILWLVGIDYNTIKEWDYAWTYLIDRGLIEKFGGVIETAQNNPRQGNMVIRVRWPFKATNGDVARSVLEGKSASNERTLQGEEIKTCILSESAEHEKRILTKYLETRCGRIIFPTTPKRRAMWLHDMKEAGEQDDTLGIRHYQFNRFCNPAYDHERYDRARRKSELTYGSIENDPEFLEQFEGRWTFEGGKVLPFTWVQDEPGAMVQRCNVILTGAEPRWMRWGTSFVSTDYGYEDNAVALLWYVSGDGELVIADEVYEKHLDPTRFVERIGEMVGRNDTHPDYYVGDPKRPHVASILRDKGLPLFDRVSKNQLADRAAGFQELRDVLGVDPMVNRPTMRVHEKCENTIREMKLIRFKDGVTNEFGEGALRGDDDAIDAARYGIRSKPRARSKETNPEWLREWKKLQRERSAAVKMSKRPGRMVGRNPGLMVGA